MSSTPLVIFLCAHGSRDPRSAPQLAQLTAQAQQVYGCPVYGGVLEQGTSTLGEQIRQVVRTTQPKQLVLLPLFLIPGTHAAQDLPAALQQLEQEYPEIEFQQTLTLSESPALLHVLQKPLASAQNILLFAHGSRRASALEPLHQLKAALAARLDRPVDLAFYQPNAQDLTDQLTRLAQPAGTGLVLPLFLFDGGLIDWAATQVCDYPGWSMGQPLGQGGQLLPVLSDLLGRVRGLGFSLDKKPK